MTTIVAFQLALVAALVCTGADAFNSGSIKPFSLRSSGLKDSGHSLGQRHLKLESRKISYGTNKNAVKMLSMGLESEGSILLAGEIFGQVALGGVGIILSGFLGALFVGTFANVDDLEREFAENNASEMEKNARLADIAQKTRLDSIPLELKKEMDAQVKDQD